MTDGGSGRGRMARPRLLLGAGGLLVLLVSALALFSVGQIEEKALAAAEAEGLALLQAVSTGVERSLVASATVERLLAERLAELARDFDDLLGRSPGQEERLLRAFVRARSLKGAVLLDRALAVRFAADASDGGPSPPGPPSPLSRARLTSLVAEDLVRRAREKGLGERDSAVVGFGENPFGTRFEFLVGAALPQAGGFLLLRLDAERLAAFRREEGVERLLADAARTEGIEYLILQGGDGRVLAASDPARIGEVLPPAASRPVWRESATGRVLDVSVPARFEGVEAGALRVGLAAGPVEGVVSRGRRSVLLFSVVVLLVGAAGAAGLLLTDRARRRREEAFARQLRDREQAALLGQMSAGVAHEVRSPLNAIGMAAQRLEREVREDPPDAERIRGIAGATRKEVARLNRIVEDFLELGRSRPLDFSEFDLLGLVGEVVLAEDPAARTEGGPGPVPIRADREELRKAVANLVRNARQAAGEAVVVVACRREGAAAVVEVRDGGPGIPPEEREKVFRHFYTKRPGGTGLGLAVARAAVEKHGGRLELGAAPEGGARFTVTIPAGGEG